jgi:hypothetical protein
MTRGTGDHHEFPISGVEDGGSAAKCGGKDVTDFHGERKAGRKLGVEAKANARA